MIISEHTIHCSKEQTCKALELGASIEIEDTRDRYSFLPQYSDSMGCRIKKFEDAYKNCYCDETAAYLIPTGEQMIGWLEEQDCISSILVDKDQYERYMYVLRGDKRKIIKDAYGFPSRK